MNVGKEPGENWTPLEALGVALRAVDKVDDIYVGPYNTPFEVKAKVLAKVRVELAEGFVAEGTGGLKS